MFLWPLSNVARYLDVLPCHPPSPFLCSRQTFSPKCISLSSALPSISYPFRHQPQTHLLFNPSIPRPQSLHPVGHLNSRPPRFVGHPTIMLPPGGINEHRSPAVGPPSRERVIMGPSSGHCGGLIPAPCHISFNHRPWASSGTAPRRERGAEMGKVAMELWGSSAHDGVVVPRFFSCGAITAAVRSNRVAI